MKNLSYALRKISKLPAEELRDEILLLAKKLEKEELRLARNRSYTKRWREKSHGEVILGASHGEIPKPLINNKTPHGESHGEISHGEVSYISKKVSKKESKNIDRRVSQKRSQIPIDLVCSEKNVSDAMSIGIPSDIIPHEWQKFHSHHLHKGTLGVNWNAAWNLWCRKSLDFSKDKSQSHAKPLSFREAAIIGNRRRALDLAENPFVDTFLKPDETPETPLGSPTPRLVSPNGHPDTRRNVQGNGSDYGGLFGKGSG